VASEALSACHPPPSIPCILSQLLWRLSFLHAHSVNRVSLLVGPEALETANFTSNGQPNRRTEEYGRQATKEKSSKNAVSTT